MNRIRLMLAVIFCALAAGAVASSSASALPCATMTGAVCLAFLDDTNTTEELVLIWPFLVIREPSTNFVLAVVGIGTIECEEAAGDAEDGSVEKESSNVITLMKVSLSKCKLVSEATCKVASFETKALGATFSLVSEKPDYSFKPETGEEIAGILVTGCERESVLKITGQQLCEAPEVEEWSEVHTLECLPAGSKLKDGTKEATLQMVDLLLPDEPRDGLLWMQLRNKY